MTPESLEEGKESIAFVPHVKLEDIKILEDSEATHKLRDLVLANLEDRRKSACSVKSESNAARTKPALEQSTVIETLERHQLTVEVAHNRDLSVLDGLVKVKYPYSSDSCSSTNAIVLNRVKNLLDEASG